MFKTTHLECQKSVPENVSHLYKHYSQEYPWKRSSQEAVYISLSMTCKGESSEIVALKWTKAMQPLQGAP